jgi:hypothetical protein
LCVAICVGFQQGEKSPYSGLGPPPALRHKSGGCNELTPPQFDGAT